MQTIFFNFHFIFQDFLISILSNLLYIRKNILFLILSLQDLNFFGFLVFLVIDLRLLLLKFKIQTVLLARRVALQLLNQSVYIFGEFWICVR